MRSKLCRFYRHWNARVASSVHLKITVLNWGNINMIQLHFLYALLYKTSKCYVSTLITDKSTRHMRQRNTDR